MTEADIVARCTRDGRILWQHVSAQIGRPVTLLQAAHSVRKAQVIVLPVDPAPPAGKRSLKPEAGKRRTRSLSEVARLFVIEVSARTGVSQAEILGAGQTIREVDARGEAMWMLRQRGVSYPMIGSMFNRHHSSVISAVRRHEEKLKVAA